MGLRNGLRVSLALVAVLLVAACRIGGTTVTTDGAAAAPKVVVELDVFSGVPNLRWTLDDDSAARLATFVSQLEPASDGSAPSDPDLGFRGFVVHGLDLGSVRWSPGADVTLRVRGDDVVATTTGDRHELLTDSGHEMYTMLRELALDQLPSDIAAHIPTGGR